MKIQHHSDARGLAVNVKRYNIGRLVPEGGQGTEAQQERAYGEASERWWAEAGDIAKRHGFAAIYSAGRMGGWLYTDPLPEPTTDDDGNEVAGAEYPAAFIAELSAHLENAAQLYADTLADVIASDAEDGAYGRTVDAALAALAAHDAKPAPPRYLGDALRGVALQMRADALRHRERHRNGRACELTEWAAAIEQLAKEV